MHIFRFILPNYAWSILFYQDRNHNVLNHRLSFMFVQRCIVAKDVLCKRKTLSERPNEYPKASPKIITPHDY